MAHRDRHDRHDTTDDRDPTAAPPSAAAYPSLGALAKGGAVEFRVWAPKANDVTLVIEGEAADDSSPREIATARETGGYFAVRVESVGPGARYRYRIDGNGPFPDPASRFQPEGVHGPSEVIDPGAHVWSDADWRGVAREDLVFYELHVGTFTPEGTYRTAREKLPYLADLGITAIELMPLHDFPGRWNWGYDPGGYFAPSRAYGRPEDLRAFVDDAHAHGLAVILDVVYNHLGPDGSYLPVYGDVFSERHETLWGASLDFDGDRSGGLRRFFVENALHWLTEYHIDGFRLDATFAIVDESEPHFLAELADAVARVPGWRRHLIAEDNRNLRDLLVPRDAGGYGLDGVWADDFHHQVRVRLAGDRHGYYRDFRGTDDDLVRTIEQGWFYAGQRSEHQGAPRGTPTDGLPREAFVYCISNHDQVGNRAQGERLHHDISPAAYRAATAVLLFVPQLPLLFMGQEWAASAPFLYFTDHEGELGRKVTQGRKKEFEDFPFQDPPDPQDPETFHRSKLDWGELDRPPHSMAHRYYRDLLEVRAQLSGDLAVSAPVESGLVLHRGRHRLMVALDGGVVIPRPEGMEVRLGSEEPVYTDDPQPPEIGGGPARPPHVPREPSGPPELGDAVRFWRPGALLWEAV